MTVEAIDHLNTRDFQRLARFIHEYSGIKMPPAKKSMVEGRLRRRARAVGVQSLTGYCQYLFEQNGLEGEAIHLIDAVTTNKTDFFREPDHFRFLVDKAIPELLSAQRGNSRAPIKVWSAASSIGAEPYTLAMVLAEVAAANPNFRSSIFASDICTEVLETAVLGIYPESMIAPVPMELRKRYLMRAKAGARDRVRIVPQLRAAITFGRINLMESPYAADSDMHIIFLRNILIYFDKPTQCKVLEQLCNHLRPGGFLFLGHSETLTGYGLPLQPVATTVFRRQ
jgi:chemotaxis protein methyltransferase CheR